LGWDDSAIGIVVLDDQYPSWCKFSQNSRRNPAAHLATPPPRCYIRAEPDFGSDMTNAIVTNAEVPRTPEMPTSSDRVQWWVGLAVLGVALLSTLTVGHSPFIDPDEYYYITAARRMVETGDWITPHFNGEPRILKPVLFYWIIAGADKLFGPYVTVARLCSAAAAAGGVLLVWLMGQHLLGRRAALLAALFAAAHLAIAQTIRFATTDTTLWLFCCLANYAWIRIALPREGRSPPARWAYFFFAAVALALLTKGPIALAWCFVPMLWLIIRRDWKALGRFRWGRGVLLALLLVLPWAIPFVLQNARQFDAQILSPNSYESYYQFAHPVVSLWQIPGIFLQLLPSIFPLLPFIVLVVFNPRRLRFRSQLPCRGFLFFWLAALLVILAFAARKSFRYMLPPIAPTALLLGGYALTAMDESEFAPDLAMIALVYGIAMLVTAVPIAAVVVATHHLDTRWLWLHLAVGLAAAAIWLGGYSKPIIHRLTPAILVAVIYLQGGLINLTASHLTGPTVASLAPRITAALKPDQRLLLNSNLTPKYLIFLARRNQQQSDTPRQLAHDLQSAQACLLRRPDWLRVPPGIRAQFTMDGQCLVARRHGPYYLDLSRDFEPAILMVRRR
jgi:4-amino-4-deoxy-L-arabinose transferase-like glycosyltransferase